ncbi:Uncharacterised protein [Mycobacterium tuberculosis]|nr:Uncharacterised protein [Mycobacterium tuberculosis]
MTPSFPRTGVSGHAGAVQLVDLGGWQHESVVDAQIGAFDRTQFDELFDDVINGRVQQVVGVPALKTLRRGLARLSEKSG